MVSRFFIITFIQKSEFYSFIGSLNIIFRGNRYVLDYVKPICLPYEDDVDENYEEFEKEAKSFHKLWVAGWGATTARGIFDIIHMFYIHVLYRKKLFYC